MPAVPMPPALSRGLEAGDPYALGLLFLGLVIFVAIAALSHEHARTFSATAIYLALGLLASLLLPVIGAGRLDPLRDEIVVERLCELTLIVAVFAAGLSIQRNVERRSWVQIAVLLVVVMPLTIGLVAVFASE